MQTYKNIDSYIKNYSKEEQKLLKKMRTTIKKAAPRAQEKIAYGIPTFTLHGNLVHFGSFKDHIGFFPASSGVSAFKKELSSYKTSKGTVRFPFEKPIPYALVTKIVKFRVRENAGKAGVVYHNDGSLWAKGKNVAGKMQGYWEWFRKDGSRMGSGNFAKGKQVGTWTTYDKKGKIVRVRNLG